jgi:hypothetical protein
MGGAEHLRPAAELLRRSPHHHQELALLRLRRAAQDGRLQVVPAPLPDLLRQGHALGRTDRRHLDDRTAVEASVEQEVPDGRGVLEHQEDGLAPGDRLLRAAGHRSAGRGERLGLLPRPVVDGHLVSGGEQPLRHGPPHEPGPDPCDPHRPPSFGILDPLSLVGSNDTSPVGSSHPGSLLGRKAVKTEGSTPSRPSDR